MFKVEGQIGNWSVTRDGTETHEILASELPQDVAVQLAEYEHLFPVVETVLYTSLLDGNLGHHIQGSLTIALLKRMDDSDGRREAILEMYTGNKVVGYSQAVQTAAEEAATEG